MMVVVYFLKYIPKNPELFFEECRVFVQYSNRVQVLVSCTVSSVRTYQRALLFLNEYVRVVVLDRTRNAAFFIYYYLFRYLIIVPLRRDMVF